MCCWPAQPTPTTPTFTCHHPTGEFGEPAGAWRSRGVAHSTRVGQHPLDVGVVVDGVLLVAGAEVEDPARAAHPRAAAAEHLAAGERRDEDQLVGRRDRERLAVHLLRVDHDRVRHAGRDRVRRVDRPDQLALAFVAPAQVARRPEQRLEDLRVVRRSAGRAGPCRRAPPDGRARRPRRRPGRGRCAPTTSTRRCCPGRLEADHARAARASRFEPGPGRRADSASPAAIALCIPSG